jgi:hypothetical protein
MVREMRSLVWTTAGNKEVEGSSGSFSTYLNLYGKYVDVLRN